MTTKKQKPKKQRTSTVEGIVFDHARIDTSHCLADGLFAPVVRGARNKSPLDVAYRYKTARFQWERSSGRLCIKDQQVFLAIHRIAAQPKRTIRVGPDYPDSNLQSVRSTLGLALEASHQDCLITNTTLREIAHTLGLKISGPALSRIEESLERLALTSHSIFRNDSELPCWKTQLIGVSKNGNERQIAFSPLLSKALVSAPTTFIDMTEVRSLKTDASVRLLVWLSGWLRPCEGKRIGLDLLIKHVWGDTGEGNVLYVRRNSLKKALAEIDENTTWDCKHDEGSGSVYIQRKKLGTTASEATQHRN